MPGERDVGEEAVDGGDAAEEDKLQTAKEEREAQEFAEDVVEVGEGADEYGLGGVLTAIPLDELGGQEGGDDALIEIEELQVEQGKVAGDRAKIMGGTADGRNDGKIEEAEKEQTEGREQAEGPRAPEQAGFAAGDGPYDVGMYHAVSPFS